MTDKEPKKFIMPPPASINAISIAGMIDQIQEGLEKYNNQNKGPLHLRHVKKKAELKSKSSGTSPCTHQEEQTTLFQSQLKPSTVFPIPSLDPKSIDDLPGFNNHDRRRKNKAIYNSNLGTTPLTTQSSTPTPFFKSKFSVLSSGDAKPTSCQRSRDSAAFPSFQYGRQDSLRGSSCYDQLKLPHKPKSAAMTFAKPTFGEDYFANSRVNNSSLSQHHATAKKSRKRTAHDFDSSSLRNNLAGAAPASASIPMSFGLGYGPGFSHRQPSYYEPTKEEVDDFVAFADKWIPTKKRQKTNNDDGNDEGGKKSSS